MRLSILPLKRKNAKILPSHFYRWRQIALLLVFALVNVIAATLYGLTPAKAANADWPTYLNNYQRTSAGTDTTITAANAAQLQVSWSFKTGGPIASSPTVVGGTVYVGSWDGNEYALDAATGTMKWKTFLGQTTAPCYPQLAGVSSAADVQNGVLYVGGGDSYWYALDATTGNVLWKVFVGDNTKGWYNWASPLIYNGYAYIGTSSVGDCPLVPGQLLQVSLSTHTVVNSFNLVPQGQYGGGIWTTPALDTATNTIFLTTGTRNQPNQNLTEAVVALDASTLALKSAWPIPASQEVVDSDFGSSPILFTDAANNQLVGAINKNGLAYAYNRNNLATGPVWSRPVTIGGTCPQCGDGSASSAAFANNTLYMGGGSMVVNGQGYKGIVNALDPATGNIIWQHGAPGQVIPAIAYSNGLIFDGAGPTLEVLDATNGTRLYSYTTGGLLYAAPSIANGQVFTGGTDNSVYAFGLPSTIPPTPTPDPTCPAGWSCQDIAGATPAGSETTNGNTWSINGGGAGVNGTSDQFRFVSQGVSGNTQISAQVLSQSVTGNAGQAGLMIRQTNAPASVYYAVFLKSNNQLVVQYRLTPGGATTTVTLAKPVSPPLYLEIQRVGDQFQAATSSDGVTYTLVPGDSAVIPMPIATLAGVATSSGTQGTQNTVTYSAVTLQSPATAPNAAASATACPASWNCTDVGNPLTVGDQALNGGVWTVKGAGIDIHATTDQFHYVSQSLAADGSISAHITAQSNTNGSAKAGVMLRQTTDTASAYYGAFVTPNNGVVVQYRPTPGLKTYNLFGATNTVPTYLMVARSSGTYCTYSSNDGINWSYVIGTCLPLSLNGSILAGLAVTSDNVGTLSNATFDTVNISNTAPPAPTNCPTGWNCADIGNANPAGSQSVSGGTWTVLGGGNDIYGTVDQFHYVWQSLAGDGVVSAHVTSQTQTDVWAKAGVMLRQSNYLGAMYYAAFVTPGNGIVVQYRATQDGGSQQSGAITTGKVPTYLEVSRTGNAYSAYTSSDGNTWTLVPGSSVTLGMTGSLLAGMAMTSHNSSALGIVTFDTVNIQAATALPCPVSWTCADIGTPTPAGNQTLNSGTWTIQAGGSDIYNTTDQFHYVWQTLTGDGGISAHVTAQSSSSLWAKAGVMLRQSSDPASMYYAALVTPGNGIVVQYRTKQGGGSQKSATLTGTVPTYLEVARVGTTFTAYTSTDGITWTAVAGSSVTLAMTGSVLEGLAATSHNTTKLSTVTFDTVNLSTCPAGWNCADIGNPIPTGGQTESGGTWTIQAGGNDIYGTADQFHYAWQTVAADGSVSAHTTTQSNSGPWAKAGVMLRQSSDPGSMYYAALVTPGNGILAQYRTQQGGGTQQIALSTGTVPTYLKIARAGTTFTTYTSTDGITWTAVTSSSVSINMTGSVLAGLAATSHNSTILGTVTFDTVKVSAGGTAPTCPTGWSCADIGNPAPAGSQSLTTGTWTIQAGGNDIFGTSDQFHYTWQSLAGDGNTRAHITSQSNSSSWAKAGVMLRQSNDPASAYYFALVTPGNGISIQFRATLGGGAQQKMTFAGTVPCYLAVARAGTTFTAYTSTDGVTWTPVTGSSTTINMTGTVLGGLAVTSHNSSVLGTVTFDNVNVGTTLP